MAEHTLRDLAREYGKGNLSRDNYVRSRTELLEGVVAGTVKVEHIEYAPPIARPSAEPSDSTLPRTRKRERTEATTEDVTDFVAPENRRANAAAQTEPETQPSSGSAPVLILVAAVAILVAVITTFALLSRDRDSAAEVSPSAEAVADTTVNPDTVEVVATAAVAPVDAPAQDNTGSALVREFLSAKDWSAGNMENFVGAWRQLPDADRAAAGDSVEMSQLSNEIYKKLLAVRALAAIDGLELSFNKQKALVDFSNDLGISDDRLTLPQPPAAVTE